MSVVDMFVCLFEQEWFSTATLWCLSNIEHKLPAWNSSENCDKWSRYSIRYKV